VKKCIVASGVLVRDGKVLLVKHPKLGVYIYLGGHVEEGETPIEAVEREFREETGACCGSDGSESWDTR